MAQVSRVVFFALMAVIGAEQELQAGTPERRLGVKAGCVTAVTTSVTRFLEMGAWLATSIERCEQVGHSNTQCVADWFSTVETVFQLSKNVVNAVDHCNPDPAHKSQKCTIKSLQMAEGISGVTAAGLMISDSCTNVESLGGETTYPFETNVACGDKLTGAMGALAATVEIGAHLSKQCKSAAECWAMSMQLVGLISSMADDIWYVFTDKCINIPGAVAYNACVGNVLGGTKDLMEFGAAAITIGQTCAGTGGSKGYRKYASEVPQLNSVSGFSAVNIGLAALLPLTAIVAFAWGKRTKSRVFKQTGDVEALTPITPVE